MKNKRTILTVAGLVVYLSAAGLANAAGACNGLEDQIMAETAAESGRTDAVVRAWSPAADQGVVDTDAESVAG